MKSNTPRNEIIPAIILAILAIVTITLEIIFVNEQTTKIETTLFGILELVFSIGFAWLLARRSYRKDFDERQKSFAVAAYRRILEIERAISRLLARVTRKMQESRGGIKLELDVIKEMATGVCDTTLSSVGDWSDIIGEEITKIKEIETVRRKEQNLKLEFDDNLKYNSDIDKEKEYEKKVEELENLKKSLIESLPKNLQIIASSEAEEEDSARDMFRKLKAVYEEKGTFQLEGFWAEKDGFTGDLKDLEPGNVLSVTLADVGERESCLTVFDKNSKPLGILINRIHTWGPVKGGYDGFTSSVVRAAKSSKFEIEIISVDKTSKLGRIYFNANVVRSL